MLEAFEYCPRLLTRISEMKALFQLPTASKDLMLPMMAVSPWPNAKHMARTWEKIVEASAGRRFAVDLDRSYVPTNGQRPAVGEFETLCSPIDGFASYYEQLGKVERAIPVFQVALDHIEFLRQFERVNELDRGFFFRISYNGPQQAFQNLQWLLQTGSEFVLFVDAEWQRDILLREIWVQGVIQQIEGAEDRVEVVVCSSSFPDSFSDVRQKKEIEIIERNLFSNVSRRFNQVRMTYGDWGSTRPRQAPTPMTLVRRIDLSLSRDWVCFRQSEEESYADIARRICAERDWGSQPRIWGVIAIESTANELPGSISAPPAATAARINMHLHRQAQFNAPLISNDGDEPFSDE
jgi:hypothetical protein